MILLLLGCKVSPSDLFQKTQQEKRTNQFQVTTLSSPIRIITSTSTSKIFKSEAFPGAQGNLLISNRLTNKYVKLNLNDSRKTIHPIPRGCRLMQDEKALCGNADTSTGYISDLNIYDLQTETLNPIAKGLFHQFNIFTDPIEGKAYAFKGDVNNELTLMVLDISTGKVEHEYKFEDSMWEVKPLRANPREPYFGLSRKDGNGITIAEWFPEDNQVVSKLNIDNKYQPGAFSLSPNGGQMVIAASEGIKELESNYDLLFMYDIETNTLSKIIMPPEYSFPLALFGKNSWSPDGKKLALDISVDFYDPNNIQKSLLCIIDSSSLNYSCREKSGIVAIAWSPGSNYLATLTGSRMLNIVNIESNEDYDLGMIEFPDIPFIDLQWTP